jgi:hypothetical protein
MQIMGERQTVAFACVRLETACREVNVQLDCEREDNADLQKGIDRLLTVACNRVGDVSTLQRNDLQTSTEMDGEEEHTSMEDGQVE